MLWSERRLGGLTHLLPELRIHEDIERGSNDTVKLARETTMGQGMNGGCCGGAGGR